MNDALDFARYIISKCDRERMPITNLQLQKILYYIQKKYLDSKECRAFPNVIEAWQFGPVVPDVYYYYCGFGSMPIYSFVAQESARISDSDMAIINPIIEDKRSMDPWSLVNETHKPGGAWDIIYRGGLGNHQRIPEELIRRAG